MAVASALLAVALAGKLSVRVQSEGTAPSGWTVVARPVSATAGSGAQPQSTSCAPDRECTLELVPGRWSLRVLSDGYWAGETFANIGSAGAAVDVKLLPTGHIKSAFVADSGNAGTPTTLGATFRSAATSAESARDPSKASVLGEVDCAVRDRTWDCALPAGALDVRLHSRTFVPRYLWNVTVPAGGSVAVSPMAFRRGASLVGSVDFARTIRGRLEWAQVTLVPQAPLPASQQALATMTAKPNGKGFFQFEGVPPGEFLIQAKARQFASEQRPVTILESREAQLKDPLLLDTPKLVSITVTPALDPSGKPWGIEWIVRRNGQNSVESATAASPKGSWSRVELRAGLFTASIIDHAGNTWCSRDIEVEPDRTAIHIDIPHISLAGRVRLQEKPLEGRITLVANGGSSIRLKSDEEGRFGGEVPAGITEWNLVTVESPTLKVHRTLHRVLAKPLDGSDKIYFEIDLPATQISGTVVTEDGARPKWAIIDAFADTADRDLSQTDLQPDGSFVVNGLAPGNYLLQAHAREADSDRVMVRLETNGAPDHVVLTLHPSKVVAIEVKSDVGPIPGASVSTVGAENAALVFTRTTDASGIASIEIPGGNSNVDVQINAPGFALRQFRMRKPEQAGVGARVTQIGGRLRLRFPKHRADQNLFPVVVHDRAVFSAYTLTGTGYDASREILSPLVETGPWALCVVSPAQMQNLRNGSPPPGSCVMGILAPGAELLLEAGAP